MSCYNRALPVNLNRYIIQIVVSILFVYNITIDFDSESVSVPISLGFDASLF